MLEKSAVGDSIVSYCTKCKQGLDHNVVSLEENAVAKVKCRTCGSTHKFRDPAAVKKSRAPKKREDAIKTAEMLWEACLAEAKGKERVYAMSDKYRIGDIVLHDTFGKGVVRKTYANKCDMLFKDRERLMASAN